MRGLWVEYWIAQTGDMLREQLHPAASALQAVENAIREGIIYWHAFPYNGQMELMDERHVRESVQLTHELDAKYGYKPKITLSQVSLQAGTCFMRFRIHTRRCQLFK